MIKYITVNLNEDLCHFPFIINKVKQKVNILIDIIKNERRISREEEIRLHGKPINRTIIARNKKAYTRKYKHKRLNENQ